MNKKILITVLHSLFSFLFWLMTLLVIYIFVFEVFTSDGKIGSFKSENHHSNGYSIPVKFNINIRNAVFNNYKTVNKKEAVNIKGQRFSHGQLEYINESPDDISIGNKNIISFHFDGETEYFTTEDSNYYSQGYIITKSDNLLIKGLQMSRLYIVFISLAIMFCFLKRIFSLLKKDIAFSYLLYKNVKLLGLIIVLKEVLELTISYVLGKYYGIIDLEKLVDGKTFFGGVELSMNPRLEFNFTLFLVGLSIIVLATLLKSGNKLQQENDLTI